MVKTYSFFSRTASTAVSDIVMSSSFFTAQLVNAHKKNLSNIAEILRQNHSIYVLVTVNLSPGKNLIVADFNHMLGNYY